MTFFLCKGISYLVGHKGHAYGRKTSITSVMIFEGLHIREIEKL